jgi:hypothetical protein
MGGRIIVCRSGGSSSSNRHCLPCSSSTPHCPPSSSTAPESVSQSRVCLSLVLVDMMNEDDVFRTSSGDFMAEIQLSRTNRRIGAYKF